MLYHPTIISIFAVIALITTYRFDKIFKVISIIFPIYIAYILSSLHGNISFNIMNMRVIANFEDYTILVAYAFTTIILSANLYSIGNYRKTDVILGSTYGGLSYLALFAGDMLSLIAALEVMMIISSFMIFSGGKRKSIRSSKKYFLTHLMSGNMIIIGICYLIMKTGSTEIFNLVEFINNPEYSSFIIAIMLTGMVMNVAAFPFSGWMVNYYPDASPSAFVYLISFTTKVSVIILFKFFAGYELLQYIAIVIIIYSSIKAVLENNLFSTLCLLSIMQIGFMVFIISIDSDNQFDDQWITHALSSYLFMHILYKGLLSLITASLADHGQISNCNDICKIKNPTILAAIVIGIAAMVNVPISATFMIKNYITHFFADNLMYFTIIFLSMMTVIALPWYRYINSNKTVILNLNIPIKLAIYFTSIVVLIATFGAGYLPFISQMPIFNQIVLLNIDSMKQLGIICIAVSIAIFLKRSRSNSYTLNFTELLGDILFFLYYYLDKRQVKDKNLEKEPLMPESAKRNITAKLQIMHNQQTAIFIVFTIFIVLLVSFIIRV